MTEQTINPYAILDVPDVMDRFLEWTGTWHHNKPNETDGDDVSELIRKLHRINFNLWHMEDRARRRDISDHEIVMIKHRINTDNQKRHQSIEQIDIAVNARLNEHGINPNEDAVLHTESPGSILDRLSVLALRRFHLEEELQREGAGLEHEQFCQLKLEQTVSQTDNLVLAFESCFRDVTDGKRIFFISHELKLYNNPLTNPELYRHSGNGK